jgi:hypothetical protein
MVNNIPIGVSFGLVNAAKALNKTFEIAITASC